MYVDSCSPWTLSDLAEYWIATQIQRDHPAPSDAQPVIDVEFTPVMSIADYRSAGMAAGEQHVPCLASPLPDGLLYGRTAKTGPSPRPIRPPQPLGQLIDVVA